MQTLGPGIQLRTHVPPCLPENTASPDLWTTGRFEQTLKLTVVESGLWRRPRAGLGRWLSGSGAYCTSMKTFHCTAHVKSKHRECPCESSSGGGTGRDRQIGLVR